MSSFSKKEKLLYHFMQDTISLSVEQQLKNIIASLNKFFCAEATYIKTVFYEDKDMNYAYTISKVNSLLNFIKAALNFHQNINKNNKTTIYNVTSNKEVMNKYSSGLIDNNIKYIIQIPLIIEQKLIGFFCTVFE